MLELLTDSIRCELAKLQFNSPPFHAHLTYRHRCKNRDPEAVNSSNIVSAHKFDPGILRPRNLLWMLTSAHRRIRFMMLVIALTASTWSSCQAVGSFQTKPAFPSAVRADDPPQPPAIARPNASASAFVGGCGKGRVGDPQTHRCRGPADIWGIAP